MRPPTSTRLSPDSRGRVADRMSSGDQRGAVGVAHRLARQANRAGVLATHLLERIEDLGVGASSQDQRDMCVFGGFRIDQAIADIANCVYDDSTDCQRSLIAADPWECFGSSA